MATRSTPSMPDWIRPTELDAEVWHMPAVRAGSGGELREIARAYRDANHPASYETRLMLLRNLRAGTIARAEHPDEARVSFEKLLADLSDVPEDILRDGCSAYVNQPGKRFFPRSAGELREFTNPLQIRRSRRAYRLREMAEAADEMFDPADRCSSEDAAAIMAEFGLRSESPAEQRRHLGPPRNPTAEELAQIAREMGIGITTQAEKKAKAA